MIEVDVLSQNPREFSIIAGVFEYCSPLEYKKLIEIIGQPVVDFIRNNPDLCLYQKRQHSGYEINGSLYILKGYERAVLFVFKNAPQTNSFESLEINFTFWDELLKTGKSNVATKEERLRPDTLKFLKTMNQILMLIDNSCPVEFSGSEAQRDAIWSKAIDKLREHGKTNLRMKPKKVIKFSN
ncbi:MAG: hypothetical protein COU63_00760 [Candidatus Pacebacteria bacterium CG10_big_fil_rev_8_21_14_0_10_36_11]|nr:hypothetical protein [Candidatus Pacearchaeota archaeon]OIP74552.1 MAG: hypothetical protein AUK08_00360 [Candidatus Pacebacteria bacterium CG2_30_36_39]PIR65177.1 MAG: hypothetical protein COU63_00760 [Candidatus Pacebacteria bacterium CG10_big_fil_rev_8_21_14_0_10_36_11]PJC43153.1 MAG: hypothetical protein CO040_00650 [Candidatus Pacebacteria bacterium CG_4_9_14_0_2_um_filter_36_8]